MKKLLTIFLCITLMLTMIPTAAFAADNNLTVSGSGIESDPYLVYSEEDLVAAVQAGGWITLQENIALTQVIKIAKENTVKLDLNGKTLAGQLEITGHLMVEDTDMNGMIANSEKNVTVTVKQYGTLTLNSGIIENTANNGNAVKLEYRGDITFTMNGGSVSSEKGIPLNAMMGTVVIHGGEMISGNDSDTIKNSYGDADITVGGGDNPVYIAKLNQGSGGKLILHEGSIIGQLSGTGLSEDSILDGLFETDVSSLLPDGLTCQEIRVQEKTYYEVVSLPAEDAVAQIGEKLYFNVAKAASSIKSGETLTLLKDYIAEVPLELRQYGVTIDLNGYNITNTSGKNNDNGVGLLFYPRYGSSYPSAPTVTVKNSKASGGNISAYLPLKVRSGDSSKELPVAMEGNVTLTCIDGGDVRIVLGSATYAKYSEEMVSAIANGGFKAEVGTNDVRIYGTYASAAAVDKDGTVELLNDYIGSESITTGPIKGTLDMQNHTFTTSNKKIIDVNYDDADLTIKNGKLIGAEGKTTIGAEMLYENTKLTLENVTIDLTSEEGHGIACNGSTSNNTTIVLKNSELNIPNGLGIYFPCSGSVSIMDSTIHAKYFGVQICAGMLHISGDKTEIAATGTPEAKTEGDGPIFDGAAVSIVNRTGYNKVTETVITGGHFEASSGVDAVKAYSFDGSNKTEEKWEDAKDVIDISAGTFSTKVPDEYCADGFTQVQNPDGSFSVSTPYTGGGSGSYPTIQFPEIKTDGNATVALNLLGTTATITVTEGFELVDVTVNGLSKGKVTTVTGLRTGDVLTVTTRRIVSEEEQLKKAVESIKLIARSQMSKAKGKTAIKIQWYTEDNDSPELDGYEIFRSIKRYSGFTKKPIFKTTKESYYNTAIKTGTKYYYKVRGYKIIEGEKVYTPWSTKAWRTVK